MREGSFLEYLRGPGWDFDTTVINFAGTTIFHTSCPFLFSIRPLSKNLCLCAICSTGKCRYGTFIAGVGNLGIGDCDGLVLVAEVTTRNDTFSQDIEQAAKQYLV